MKQKFEIIFEYRADDKGYTPEELLDLLNNTLGNEYDIEWYSVKLVENMKE